jgi:hypothetical protein
MKKLFLFFILVVNLGKTEAQVIQEGFFSVKFHTITWTKIYSGFIDLERLKNNPQLKFSEDYNGVIKKSKPLALSKKALREISANFFIVQKEGWYKVDVVFIDEISVLKNNSEKVLTNDSKIPIEKACLTRNGEFNDFFYKHISKPYDKLFSSFFDPEIENDGF